MHRMTLGISMALMALLAATAAVAEGDHETYRLIGGEKLLLKFEPAGLAEASESIVSDDGYITLPTGTSVKLKGKTPSEARDAIAEQMVKDTNAKTVKVKLSVLEYPPRKVYVAGEVRKPASITLTPGVPLSLLGALQETGGVAEQGDPTRVNVVHTDNEGRRTSQTFDTTKLAQPGSADLGPRLVAGDTVVVPRCDHFIFTGEFNRTGLIALGDLHFEAGEKPLLSRVVEGVGGFKREADVKKLKILRLKNDGSREVLTPFEQGIGTHDPLLLNSDIVDVPALLTPKEKIQASVSLTGKVRTPGLYPIGESGLKLSKLIVLAGGLLDTAKGKKVTVNRPANNGALMYVDVDAILKKGSWELDVELKDGDVVNVPERAF